MDADTQVAVGVCLAVQGQAPVQAPFRSSR